MKRWERAKQKGICGYLRGHSSLASFLVTHGAAESWCGLFICHLSLSCVLDLGSGSASAVLFSVC